MIYGYCRISTAKQSIERQVRNIESAYSDATIIRETYTGTTTARPAFERLLKRVEAGDTIVFDSVSRMARDAEQGVETYMRLYDASVKLVFLKEPHIDTDVYADATAKQLPKVDAGDADTNVLCDSIMSAVKRYMDALARRQIVIAFEQAQKEVDDLHQRTKEGILTARNAGKQIGRAIGSKPDYKKAKEAKEAIKKYSKDFDGVLDDADVMKLAGCSRNSYYKYKRELRNA